MHTVIKGKKSVTEFKELQTTMERLATNYSTTHKKAFENWRYGEIKKVWFDSQGNLCIEYDSGNWWHYNELGEWW